MMILGRPGVVSIVLLEEDYGSVLGEVLLDGGEGEGMAMAELFDFVGCLTVLSVLVRASSVGELNDLCTDETVRAHALRIQSHSRDIRPTCTVPLVLL